MIRLRIAKRATKLKGSVCPSCGWKKIVHRFDDGEAVNDCPRCHPRLHRLAEQMIALSGLPKMCHGGIASIERNDYNRQLLDDFECALDEPSQLSKESWFLHGATGSGKTLHSGAFGVDLIRRRLWGVRFIQVSEYLNGIKKLMGRRKWLEHELNNLLDIERGWGSKAHELRQVEAKLNGAFAIEQTRILILDDFNRSYRDGFEQDRLYDIIDSRYRNRSFTIFTAQDKKLAALPEQTASRVFHMSHAFFLGAKNRRAKMGE